MMVAERATTLCCRAVNRLGGKYGEVVAGRLLARVPSSALPGSGHRTVHRAGFLWTLDLTDNLQRTLYFTGSYDDVTVRAVRARLQPSDVVLDVGANIGTFTLPVAAMLGREGRVIAVEPAADTASILREQTQRNNLAHVVKVVQVALSDRPRHAYLRSGDDAADSGLRTLEGEGRPIGTPVRVTTIDLLCKEIGLRGVDVLKIDVEGHEQAILRGMTEILHDAPPRLIVIEVNSPLLAAAGSSPGTLLSMVSEMGYRGYAIRHRGLDELRRDARGNALFERGS